MMKTASKVLGIIGGIIALIVAVVFIVISITFRGSDHSWLVNDIPANEVQIDSGVAGQIAALVASILAFIAGVLGLTGGIIVKPRPVASGVMMVVGAVLSLFSYCNILSFILLVLGAIFALKKETAERHPNQATMSTVSDDVQYLEDEPPHQQ